MSNHHAEPGSGRGYLRMDRRKFFTASAAALGVAAVGGSPAGTANAATTLFFDDFTGAAGSAPNASRWSHKLGSTGYSPPAIYTDDRATSFLDGNSNLVLRAARCTDPPSWFPSAKYQSASLSTKTLFSAGINTAWEARIKFDPSKGCWPSFWTMGSVGEWPQCGEADIIELYGTSLAGSTVHTPVPVPLVSRTFQAQKRLSVDGGWHTWRMVWDTTGFRFWVDYTQGKAPYFTVPTNSLPYWPFSNDNPLFIKLQMTVGGPTGEAPISSELPVDMLVDWVRVTTTT
ncbi:glycoside hydrolase family 16 protein [Gordonia sp. NPDC003425]